MHASDGESYKHFDAIHREKAKEAHNVRVALATDGFHTPVSIKILILHDIYSSGITLVVSSLCRDNLGRHPTTLMDLLAHRRTSLATHLADVLLNLVVRHIYAIYWMFVDLLMSILVSVVNYFVVLVTL
jgi:hypothetical protein